MVAGCVPLFLESRIGRANSTKMCKAVNVWPERGPASPSGLACFDDSYPFRDLLDWRSLVEMVDERKFVQGPPDKAVALLEALSSAESRARILKKRERLEQLRYAFNYDRQKHHKQADAFTFILHELCTLSVFQK